MLACHVKGHRIRFSADGAVMRWTCERGCGEGGEKVYDSPEEAARFAKAFDVRDSDRVDRHPTLTMLPLRLLRALRGR